MIVPSEGPGGPHVYIRHLRYAIATTGCRATVDALQRMLREAEASARKQNATAERA